MSALNEWYVLKDRSAVANVRNLADRLLQVPDDQPGLWLDRLNDLRIAMWELEEVTARQTDRKRRERKAEAYR